MKDSVLKKTQTFTNAACMKMPDHYFDHPEDYTTMIETLGNSGVEYLHIQESLSQGG